MITGWWNVKKEEPRAVAVEAVFGYSKEVFAKVISVHKIQQSITSNKSFNTRYFYWCFCNKARTPTSKYFGPFNSIADATKDLDSILDKSQRTRVD